MGLGDDPLQVGLALLPVPREKRLGEGVCRIGQSHPDLVDSEIGLKHRCAARPIPRPLQSPCRTPLTCQESEPLRISLLSTGCSARSSPGLAPTPSATSQLELPKARPSPPARRLSSCRSTADSA